MNTFTWLDDTFSLRLVVTLAHFLWQGAAVALIVAVCNRLMKRASAHVRYSFNVAALLAMVACLPATFALVEVKPIVARTALPVVELPVATTPTQLPMDSPTEVASPLPESAALQVELTNSGNDEYGQEANGPVSPLPENKEARPSSVRAWLAPIAPYVSIAYSIGVALMLIRLTTALWGGQKLRRISTLIDDESLLAMVERQAKKLGMRIAPVVAMCEQISVPLVVGVLKPMILLPTMLASGLSPEQLEALITHELAHIRRYDMAVNLLLRFIEAVLFFHPAIWYVSRRVSIERENAADDMVLAAGWRRANYADALVRMAELSAALRGSRITHQATVLAASGDNASEFKRRVLRILGHRDVPKMRLTRSSFAMMLFVLMSLAMTPPMLRSWAEVSEATLKLANEDESRREDESDNRHDEEVDVANVQSTPKTTSEIPLGDQKHLRVKASLAFRAANYDTMTAIYKQLAAADNASLDDALWHGHAHHLAGRWRDSRDAYKAALVRIDSLLVENTHQLNQLGIPDPDNVSPDFANGNVNRTRSRRTSLQTREMLKEKWAQLVLLIGRMELSQLKEPQAAAETLSQGLRFAAVVSRPLDQLMIDAKRTLNLDGEKLDPDLRFETDLMYAIASVRYRAMAFEQTGNSEAAADCWSRVRLCNIAYEIPLSWVDANRLSKVLAQLPPEEIKPHHEFVRKNPGNYRSRTIPWKNDRALNSSAFPRTTENPFRPSPMGKFQFIGLGPAHANLTILVDGQLLIAYTAGDWQQSKIMLSTSRDGKNWEDPWEFTQNSVFDTRSPSVVIDDNGTIWMLFWSKRLDLARYSTAPYRLWLASSQDGHNWSTLKPIESPSHKSYVDTCQLTRDRQGNYFIFRDEWFASAKTPDAITSLTHSILPPGKNFPAPGLPQGHNFVGPQHGHATFDRQGRCHFVFDDFGQAIYYTRSENMRDWTTPVKLGEKKKNASIQYPQLLIRDDQVALVYETNTGGWLQRGTLVPEGLELAKPIEIAYHVSDLNGGRLLQTGDTVRVAAGSDYAPVMLTAELEKVLTGKGDSTSEID